MSCLLRVNEADLTIASRRRSYPTLPSPRSVGPKVGSGSAVRHSSMLAMLAVLEKRVNR
jgi:hypothetical protein